MFVILARAASPQRARSLFPGVMACGVVAAAAAFLGQHHGAPVLLFAQLLGLAMNFLAEGPCAPGIAFCARVLPRVGVALLGLRITLDQVTALGVGPVVIVVSVAATLVRLLRVAMLLPVIVLAAAITRARLKCEGGDAATTRRPLLPGFAVAFALQVAVNSTGWLPQSLQSLGNEASRWCMVAAIAGIGMKTQLKELAGVGWKPVALMVGETAFLAALVLGLMRLLG